jgi:hypothetical protein
VPPVKADRDDTAPPAFVDGGEHVLGTAAGGERKGDIAAPCQRLNLLGEDFGVAEVVGDAGQSRESVVSATAGNGARASR